MTSITICRDRLRAVALASVMVVAALIACAVTAAAQPNVSLSGIGGTYYVLAFPDTVTNRLMAKFPNTSVRGETSIWIFSPVDNSVKITLSGGVATVLNVEGGKFKVYTVPSVFLVNKTNTPLARTISVTSQSPILLTCYLATIQGTEAWTPLPVEAWGTSYQAAAIPGEVVNNINNANATAVQTTPKAAPSEITVIAAYDNTTVTLTPPPGIDFEGSPVHTVRLNQGQAYQVRSRVQLTDADSQEDLAATTIIADKPIGVISGNTRAQVTFDDVGIENNAYKNLMIEWMTPYELMGQDFVYLPTYDDHYPGSGSSAERRREFVRVYNHLNASVNGFYYQPGSTSKVSFRAQSDSLAELGFGQATAAYIHTDSPAMAMMYSSSITQMKSRLPLSYNAWAPYMVTLAPRDKWASFAPYYAPPNPGGMQHYINVVTDTLSAPKIMMETGSPFLFSRKIPGTDLIWGSMAVTPGADHWLIGKNGAKFWGFVYGLLGGSEVFRPNEFEEYNAVSYGYPLVSSYNIAGVGDTLQIDTSSACGGLLTVRVRATNASPVGLRSVRLDDPSVNTRVVRVDPPDPAVITGLAQVTVRIEAVDPLQPAFGNLLITDRTGKSAIVPYSYQPNIPTLTPATKLDFGPISIGTSKVKRVTITNRRSYPLIIRTVRLRQGNEEYTIDSTVPAGPAMQPPHDVTLAPGDSMIVMLTLSASDPGNTYADTLEVNTPCFSTPLALSAQYGEPVIYISDIDFGTMRVGDQPKTMSVDVCNLGTGVLTFGNPGGGAVVSWGLPDFSVDSVSLARLKVAQLGPNQCSSLAVTFTPGNRGVYGTTARILASTRNRRDTSVWTALVIDSPLGVPGSAVAGNTLDVGTAGASAIIHYNLAASANVRLEIYNGAGASVATLIDAPREAGEHRLQWDAAGVPAGIYLCSITSGGWRQSVPIIIVK